MQDRFSSPRRTFRRGPNSRGNARALKQLQATLDQWASTLAARIDSVDATAAQHRATQSQLIANLDASIKNLPAPASAPQPHAPHAQTPAQPVSPLSVSNSGDGLDALERGLGILSGDLGAVTGDLGVLNGNAGELASDISALARDVEDVRQVTHAAAQSSKSDIEHLRASFESWHGTTWQRIENLTARLNTLQGHLDENTAATNRLATELERMNNADAHSDTSLSA